MPRIFLARGRVKPDGSKDPPAVQTDTAQALEETSQSGNGRNGGSLARNARMNTCKLREEETGMEGYEQRDSAGHDIQVHQHTAQVPPEDCEKGQPSSAPASKEHSIDPPVIERWLKDSEGYTTKIYVCIFCDKEFKQRYLLRRHLPVHTGDRKFVCTVCGATFSRGSTLTRHRALHKIERTFICNLCQQSFNRSSALSEHMKTHSKEKRFVCFECGKGFHQKINLKNHVNTHFGVKPFKCIQCESSFSQLTNLTQHMKRKHKISQTFKCTLCGETFSKRKLLREHELEIHQSIIDQKLSSAVPQLKVDDMQTTKSSSLTDDSIAIQKQETVTPSKTDLNSKQNPTASANIDRKTEHLTEASGIENNTQNISSTIDQKTARKTSRATKGKVNEVTLKYLTSEQSDGKMLGLVRKQDGSYMLVNVNVICSIPPLKGSASASSSTPTSESIAQAATSLAEGSLAVCAAELLSGDSATSKVAASLAENLSVFQMSNSPSSKLSTTQADTLVTKSAQISQVVHPHCENIATLPTTAANRRKTPAVSATRPLKNKQKGLMTRTKSLDAPKRKAKESVKSSQTSAKCVVVQPSEVRSNSVAKPIVVIPEAPHHGITDEADSLPEHFPHANNSETKHANMFTPIASFFDEANEQVDERPVEVDKQNGAQNSNSDSVQPAAQSEVSSCMIRQAGELAGASVRQMENQKSEEGTLHLGHNQGLSTQRTFSLSELIPKLTYNLNDASSALQHISLMVPQKNLQIQHRNEANHHTNFVEPPCPTSTSERATAPNESYPTNTSQLEQVLKEPEIDPPILTTPDSFPYEAHKIIGPEDAGALNHVSESVSLTNFWSTTSGPVYTETNSEKVLEQDPPAHPCSSEQLFTTGMDALATAAAAAGYMPNEDNGVLQGQADYMQSGNIVTLQADPNRTNISLQESNDVSKQPGDGNAQFSLSPAQYSSAGCSEQFASHNVTQEANMPMGNTISTIKESSAINAIVASSYNGLTSSVPCVGDGTTVVYLPQGSSEVTSSLNIGNSTLLPDYTTTDISHVYPTGTGFPVHTLGSHDLNPGSGLAYTDVAGTHLEDVVTIAEVPFVSTSNSGLPGEMVFWAPMQAASAMMPGESASCTAPTHSTCTDSVVHSSSVVGTPVTCTTTMSAPYGLTSSGQSQTSLAQSPCPPPQQQIMITDNSLAIESFPRQSTAVSYGVVGSSKPRNGSSITGTRTGVTCTGSIGQNATLGSGQTQSTVEQMLQNVVNGGKQAFTQLDRTKKMRCNKGAAVVCSSSPAVCLAAASNFNSVGGQCHTGNGGRGAPVSNITLSSMGGIRVAGGMSTASAAPCVPGRQTSRPPRRKPELELNIFKRQKPIMRVMTVYTPDSQTKEYLLPPWPDKSSSQAISSPHGVTRDSSRFTHASSNQPAMFTTMKSFVLPSERGTIGSEATKRHTRSKNPNHDSKKPRTVRQLLHDANGSKHVTLSGQAARNPNTANFAMTLMKDASGHLQVQSPCGAVSEIPQAAGSVHQSHTNASFLPAKQSVPTQSAQYKLGSNCSLGQNCGSTLQCHPMGSMGVRGAVDVHSRGTAAATLFAFASQIQQNQLQRSTPIS